LDVEVVLFVSFVLFITKLPVHILLILLFNFTSGGAKIYSSTAPFWVIFLVPDLQVLVPTAWRLECRAVAQQPDARKYGES